jgi:hypothetical protein
MSYGSDGGGWGMSGAHPSREEAVFPGVVLMPRAREQLRGLPAQARAEAALHLENVGALATLDALRLRSALRCEDEGRVAVELDHVRIVYEVEPERGVVIVRSLCARAVGAPRPREGT